MRILPRRQDSPADAKAMGAPRVSVPAALSPHKAAAQAPSDLHHKSAASLNRLLASLGLPADRLSAAIVSFAKFFSLPLEPSLAAKIRRQSLQAGSPAESAAETDGTPRVGTESEKAAISQVSVSSASRQALSLAAAAAAGKGVELTKQGLERYAAALEGKSVPEAADPGTEFTVFGALGLKEKVLASAERDPLLDLLNRLPDKNDQHWIVLPFNFADNGNKYRLSLRILLDGSRLGSKSAAVLSGAASGDVRGMALEIVKMPAEGAEIQRRWLFAADCAKGILQGLPVCVQPPAAGKGFRLVNGLARALEIAPEKIFLKKGGDFSAFMAELLHGDLPSVNEEV